MTHEVNCVVITFILTVLIAGCLGGGHGSDLCPHHDKTCSDTDMAIVHIDWAYDDHVCDEVSKLNCADVITPNLVDEQVCGTDGQTYSSHCVFAKARCLTLSHHDKHNPSDTTLHLQNHGPCDNSTLTTKPFAQTTHAHAPESTTHANTVTTVTSMPGSSQPETTTTTMAATSRTTTMPTTSGTTTESTEHLMAQLYCQNVNLITCNGDLNVVCGSDGQFYPNKCELVKAVCKNSSLHQLSDTSVCLT